MVTVCIGFARMSIDLPIKLLKIQIHPQSRGAGKSQLRRLFRDEIVRAMRMQEYDGLSRRGINCVPREDVKQSTAQNRYKLTFGITTLIKPNNSLLKGDGDMSCNSTSLCKMLSHCKAVSYAKMVD
jgi:hypothetical protein